MGQSASAIRIDADSSTPVYRQISDAIRALLVAGSLNPGDLLPPVRQLAIDLAVHFNTVAEAYRTLAEEGWLDLRRRRGAQVIARPTPQNAPPEAEVKFAQRLREVVAATQAEGLPPEIIAQQLRRIAEGLEQCSSRRS
jgi:GntR family transcriptional regulator